MTGADSHFTVFMKPKAPMTLGSTQTVNRMTETTVQALFFSIYLFIYLEPFYSENPFLLPSYLASYSLHAG